MGKPPRERTERDLEEMEAFFREYPIFKELRSERDRDTILRAFQDMRLRTHRQGDAVVRFGEVGQEFFVVLQGRVSVRVPTIIECETRL